MEPPVYNKMKIKYIKNKTELFMHKIQIGSLDTTYPGM